MWVAVHVYVTFKASVAYKNNSILLEENIVLMNVEARQDVFDRVDDLKNMYASSCIYPGYEGSEGVLGIRKIISVLNLDGDNVSQPSNMSELSYEMYEFLGDNEVQDFIEGKRIRAKMETAIKQG